MNIPGVAGLGSDKISSRCSASSVLHGHQLILLVWGNQLKHFVCVCGSDSGCSSVGQRRLMASVLSALSSY